MDSIKCESNERLGLNKVLKYLFDNYSQVCDHNSLPAVLEDGFETHEEIGFSSKLIKAVHVRICVVGKKVSTKFKFVLRGDNEYEVAMRKEFVGGDIAKAQEEDVETLLNNCISTFVYNQSKWGIDNIFQIRILLETTLANDPKPYRVLFSRYAYLCEESVNKPNAHFTPYKIKISLMEEEGTIDKIYQTPDYTYMGMEVPEGIKKVLKEEYRARVFNPVDVIRTDMYYEIDRIFLVNDRVTDNKHIGKYVIKTELCSTLKEYMDTLMHVGKHAGDTSGGVSLFDDVVEEGNFPGVDDISTPDERGEVCESNSAGIFVCDGELVVDGSYRIKPLDVIGSVTYVKKRGGKEITLEDVWLVALNDYEQFIEVLDTSGNKTRIYIADISWMEPRE